MSEEKIIMYDSDGAAKRVDNISGWVDGKGHFFGDQESSEHLARWSGCTHNVCECGKIHRKGWLLCEVCREIKSVEKYAAMESKDWDGKTPLCLYDTDIYFFEEQDLLDYAEDHGCPVVSMALIICEPIHWRQIDCSDFLDDLPEEVDDLPSDIEKAIKDLNEVISKHKPPAWEPGKYAAIVAY